MDSAVQQTYHGYLSLIWLQVALFATPISLASSNFTILYPILAACSLQMIKIRFLVKCNRSIEQSTNNVRKAHGRC